VLEGRREMVEAKDLKHLPPHALFHKPWGKRVCEYRRVAWR